MILLTALRVTCATRSLTPRLSVLPVPRLKEQTATPETFLEITSASTISKQAVDDGATVRIYYESRLAKIELDENEKPHVDPEFEEVTEGEEERHKEKLKSKWAQLEALVGTEKRLTLVADDIITHFEERLDAMDGKAMVVCMSRRICVDLYNAIVEKRPSWHDEENTQGIIKVVMTGEASEDESWQPHIRNKARREELAVRFKNPDDPLKFVIVRDMWLTGFDAPSLHNDVCRQTDAGARPDASHRARQSRLRRKTRRSYCGLYRDRLPSQASIGGLH